MASHMTTKFDQIDWVTKFLIYGPLPTHLKCAGATLK